MTADDADLAAAGRREIREGRSGSTLRAASAAGKFMKRFSVLGFLVFFLFSGCPLQAREADSITVKEYGDLLTACSERIRGASGETGEPGSLVEALSYCHDEIGTITVSSAGQPIAVRNDWTSDLLDNARSEFYTDSEVRDEALEHLSALQDEIDQPLLYEPSDRAHRILEDVLARSEFAGRERKESGLAAWIGRYAEALTNWAGRHVEDIFRRVGDWFERIFGFLVPESETGRAGVHLGRWLLYTLGIIVVLLLLYLLARLLLSLRGRGTAPSQFDEDEEIVELPRPDELLARASGFRSEGNYRAAMRFCYLALIAFLEDRGLVRYDRSKTNWEYARELGTGFDRRDLFVSLTSSFDTAWYGMREVRETDLTEFREGCDEIVDREGEPA